ncbi:hypothetical protein GCM10027592_22320 [Spirosoma flavus]
MMKTIGLLILLWLAASNRGYGQTNPASIVRLITQYRAELKTARTNKERARLLFNLADYYSTINKDSAIYFIREGIPLAINLTDKHFLVDLYGELGRYYEDVGNTAEALSTFQKAETIALQAKNDSATAHARILLANFYTKQGNDEQALHKVLAALSYFELYKNQKKALICKIYNTLGIIYSNQKNYLLSLHYFDQLKETGATILNGYYVYLACINASEVYTALNDFQQAETTANQALLKARELKNDRGVGFGYGQLADIMLKRKRYPEAIEYGKKALQIREQLADLRLTAMSDITLAEIYYELKDYGLALPFASQAVTLLTRTHDRNKVKALEIQAQILEKQQEDKQAFSAYKAARELNDSLTNIERAREISRIQGSFDLERKQRQIQLLNNDLAIQQLQAAQRQKQVLLLNQAKQASDLKNQLLSRKEQLSKSQLTLQRLAAKRQETLIAQQQTQLQYERQQRFLYGTIVALLIGVISLISYFFRRQQKAQHLLSRQHTEIQQQALRLVELNATKDKLFSLIGHDLRSPMASLKASLQQIQQGNKGLNSGLSRSLSRLDSQVDTVITLLTNLLDWSMMQLKGLKPNLRPITLSDIIEEVISLSSDTIRYKKLTIINQVRTDAMVMVDHHQLAAIVRNILSNAVKFTPPEGYIRLHTLTEPDWVELRISDTGIGMTTQQVADLFHTPQVRPGTLGEPGTGLGLQICRELIERQGGRLHFESTPDKGTQVRIRLPAANLLQTV